MLQNYALAGFGNRLLAAIIDGILVSVVFSFVVTPLVTMLGILSMPDMTAISTLEDEDAAIWAATVFAAMTGIFLISALTYLVYETLMISSSKQATVGKLILKIKVVDENGGRLTVGQALGRSLLKTITGHVCVLLWLWPLFNNKEQALHDLVINDLVVRE